MVFGSQATIKLANLVSVQRAGAFIVFLTLSSIVWAEDVNYAKLLIGKWGYLQKEDGTYWGYDEYLVDGTVHAWGVHPDTQQKWEIWGIVKVSGNISCSTTTKSSNPTLIPVGVEVCDEIVSIDEHSIIWRHQDGNMTMVDKVSE